MLSFYAILSIGMSFRFIRVDRILRPYQIFRRSFNTSTRLHYSQWMSDWKDWNEDYSRYENGIYFPVYLGDIFGNGRYRVLHKLGIRDLSQIWLAKDQFPRSGFLIGP